MIGSCHCGNVRYEVEGPFDQGLSCNCSICLRKGTILAFVPKTKFKLLAGEGHLTDYQFGKKTIHHYFCSTCGVTSFAAATMPDGTEMRAINLRCIENIHLDNLKINHFDGKSL